MGNIPYDAKEEDLKKFFERVGPVVSFRLIRDKDSNKPKGYGFCEFREREYARSAIRNMNEVEFNGRALRVDYSEKHRTSLLLPGQMRTQNSLQDVLTRLSTQENIYLLSLLQNFSRHNEEEFQQIMKARPYLLFSLLKMMVRINGEFSDVRYSKSVVKDGLLPLPTDEAMFIPPGHYPPHFYPFNSY